MTNGSLLDRFRLDGRIAIVTGASSGIGNGVAAALAEAGATVYAVARREERLAALAAAHRGVQPWPTDLADEEARERLVAEILGREARVDVLVNAAGVAGIGRAQDESTAAFGRVVDLNLGATFVLSREVGRAMIDRGHGGSIVNVASAVGTVGIGRPPQAGYVASKAGCVGLTRELSAQWARKRIRVNALAPGWVETEMTRAWLATEPGGEAVRRLAPLGRAATIDEIACAALFLASDASSYVTGAVLAVDGGWTAV